LSSSICPELKPFRPPEARRRDGGTRRLLKAGGVVDSLPEPALTDFDTRGLEGGVIRARLHSQGLEDVFIEHIIVALLGEEFDDVGDGGVVDVGVGPGATEWGVRTQKG
jgi:hypothetical protein